MEDEDGLRLVLLLLQILDTPVASTDADAHLIVIVRGIHKPSTHKHSHSSISDLGVPEVGKVEANMPTRFHQLEYVLCRFLQEPI